MPQQAQQESFSPFAGMTWREKVTFVTGLLMFPVLTVIVLLRHRLGFRAVQPWRLFLMAFLLIFGPMLAGSARANLPFSGPQPGSGYDVPLTIFAIAMLAAGLVQRHQRWSEFQKGKPWHSYYRGDPWIEPLLQRFGLRLRRDWIFRFVEPALVLFVGVIFLPFFHALAYWLIFCALALNLFEQVMFERELEGVLDIQDSMCAADMHAGGGTPRKKTPPLILPTGPAADTQRLRSPAARVAGTALPAPLRRLIPANAFASAPRVLWIGIGALLAVALAFAYVAIEYPITSLFSSSHPAPGVVDVSGTWGAVQTFGPKTQVVFKLVLSQNGTAITGTSGRDVTIPGQPYSTEVANVQGVAEANSATLHEISVARQSNSSKCLIETMTLTPTGSGTMRATWEQSGARPCPAGDVTLSRSSR